jgi:LCP family protein required for cell wall assembly
MPQGSAFCANCGTPMQSARSAAATMPVTGRMPATAAPGRRVPAAVRRRAVARRKPWYRRMTFMVPLVLLVMLLTGLGVGAWYVTSRFDGLNRLSTPPAEISGGRLGGDDQLTIDTNAAMASLDEASANNPALADSPDGSMAVLMMGVDARPGEPIDVDVRPDSLAVVFLDGRDNSCRMLSIPRDTRTELPGYGQSKINHALAVGGVPYEQLVVEHLLGIEIDHYGLIDFSGVTQLVDAVGGITVTNDEAFEIDGIQYPVGTQQLQGHEALMYARYRGGADGDFGRQERQQEVVRALMSEGASLDVVTAVPQLLSAVEGHVRTDMGPKQMVDLGQRFRSGCTSETLETARLEGTVSTMYDDLMQQDLSFVVIDEAEISQKVAWLRGDAAG